ncbi:uncharacterized protein LOC134458384 [Engraulis encrasicolus]|uniref:uncharacterized protein LOC134458384 n=1 Tax=Engraulis encrasicolus TaxID=184585 RepID=UPI002FD2F6CE
MAATQSSSARFDGSLLSPSTSATQSPSARFDGSLLSPSTSATQSPSARFDGSLLSPSTSATQSSSARFDGSPLSPSTGATQSSSSSVRLEQWPSVFPLPSFSYDVELRLRKANEDFEKGKTLVVPRDMKINILEKLAEVMYSFKAYPDETQVGKVASALVQKYPCLAHPTSETGCEAWKVSLRSKIANYRQKLRNAGCREMAVNTGSRQGSLKRPKRSELNFLPDHAVGSNEEELERERAWMEEEVKRKNVSFTVLKEKMETTFSLRRKEIVQDQPLVKSIKGRWPGLFFEQEVCAEFFRINRVDLKATFLTALDSHTQGFLRLYRAKASQGKWNDLNMLLETLDAQTTDLTTHRRSTVLRGLPLYLKEQASLSKTLEKTGGPPTTFPQVGIVEFTTGQSPTITDAAVVLEGEVVMEGLKDLTTAFIMLFGLFYALNMEYPKELRYTFEAAQKIFLNLGTQCTAKIRSLKLKLLV